MADVYKTLVAARKKIDSPEKWGKGARGMFLPRRPFNTCCAAEAIEDVTPYAFAPYSDEIRQWSFRLIENCAGLDGVTRVTIPNLKFILDTIPTWNDAPERTYEDVISTYNLAVAIVKDFK